MIDIFTANERLWSGLNIVIVIQQDYFFKCFFFGQISLYWRVTVLKGGDGGDDIPKGTAGRI